MTQFRSTKKRKNSSVTRPAARSAESKNETAGDILVRLLNEQILISENGVSRQEPVLKAIVLQLWRSTLAQKSRAAAVYLKYRTLIPESGGNRPAIEFLKADGYPNDSKQSSSDGDRD